MMRYIKNTYEAATGININTSFYTNANMLEMMHHYTNANLYLMHTSLNRYIASLTLMPMHQCKCVFSYMYIHCWRSLETSKIPDKIVFSIDNNKKHY